MNAYVALLRGINVGGNKSVAMSALRALTEGLGYTDVASILQSGNVVFHSSARLNGHRVEVQLEAEVTNSLDLAADVVVRSADEWAEIVGRIPFGKEARKDPGHLIVMCLKGSVTASDVKALQASVVGPEQVRGGGSHLYITYPAGIGRSKLTNVAIEKRIGVRGTARNWNTVVRIWEKLGCEEVRM